MTDYAVDPQTGCWLWTRTKPGGNGYAESREGGGRAYVHRIYYERFKGPIPDGLVIDHLCNRSLCVNPDHLEAVQSGVNVARGSGPPALNARKTHCDQGHPLTGANLFVRSDGHRGCVACRREQSRAYRLRKRLAATSGKMAA